MTTILTATLAGEGDSNQDRSLVGPTYAAVLDGATDFAHDHEKTRERDGGWYAQQLAQALRHHLDLNPQLALPLIVEAAISDLVQQHQLHPQDCPTSTIALARWTPQHIELYLLGDSGILVETTTGEVEYYTDRRLSPIGPQQRAAYRQHLKDGYGFNQQHNHNLVALQAQQRRVRNTPQGYWIAAADPQAAHHGLSHLLDASQVQTLVVMSDGASASVLTYSQPATWQQFLTQATTQPEQFHAQIHRLENTDLTGQRWPRSKPHDDKTIVIASVTGTPPVWRPATYPQAHAPHR